MKRILLFFFLLLSTLAPAQLNIDTLAIQDFELSPQSPVWNFTGPVVYNSGYSSGSAAPPNSPIGIGGSRAWETTTNSGGLVLDFANITIPPSYDSVRVHFNLAAMNLISASGGPDDLDYVLVAYSTNGGTSYTNRLRIRGATANNSFWAYSATGVAQVYYLPTTETVFQPTTTGLQTTFGYSNCEIVFPGSITQVAMRITGRSSSSTDTWLIDNLVITGENVCNPSAATISPSACDSYTSPSGNHSWTSSGTYMDTIPNSTGCDSVLTINLTVLGSTASAITATACESYLSPSGNHTWTSSGTYADTLGNSLGCDSIVTVNLTILAPTSGTLTATACDGLVSPSGNVLWASSGTYMDTIPNAAGCDSIITATVTILQSTSVTLNETACLSYTAPSGTVYTASGTYMDTIPNAAGCDSVLTIQLTVLQPNVAVTQSGNTLSANAANATYQWIDCNNGNAPISGATSQSFTPSVNGTYAVVVTEQGCADTSSCIAVTLTGTVDRDARHVALYPNPAHHHLVLEVQDALPFATYTVHDPSGRVVLAGKVAGNTTSISIAQLPEGIYFLQLEGFPGQKLRFVKQCYQ